MTLIVNNDNFERADLSVVVPVYNEERTLEKLIDRLAEVAGLKEIVIVDDCSVDRSPAIIERLAERYPIIRSFRLEQNSGKTAAVCRGIAETTGEIVMVQDADLEYDPAEIPSVVEPIRGGYADVVYGSRFMVKKAARVVYFYHYLGNKALTFFSNALTNVNLSDLETCYKAFRGDIIRNMRITSSGFGFEVEVTAKIAKLKCAMYEVPISYYGRTYEEGKKITYRDGIAALWYIIRFNLFCSLKSSFSELPERSVKALHNTGFDLEASAPPQRTEAR
ncbi:MAG TPA: glycosyltransferase family 2 protein [Pyrinomonadaceae bacterium]